MTDTQEHIVSKIQQASNKVHQKTMRGSADVVFVSRRVMDEIEDVLNDQNFVIAEASGWFGHAAPCDIRAVVQMGRMEMDVQDPESSGGGIADGEAQALADDPGTGQDTKEEVKEQWDTLDIPEIEFKFAKEEWVETHDIALEDEVFG